MEQYDFTQRHSKRRLQGFADYIMGLSEEIGFKVSSRGWCYQLESARFINKDQFSKVENLINRCRKRGLLPIDFIAEEEGRKFSEIHYPTTSSFSEFVEGQLEGIINCENYYSPDWWEGEEYYIQLIVEKIDLKTLFRPVCHDYHIPVATSKGWSSMIQRAEYARRFKEAEDKGLKCVLLYCGDHDPDGLRISDFLRSNLEDIKYVHWEDGFQGYDPRDLIVHRFGIDEGFINKHKFTWIDNLITGSGKDLASPTHKNNRLPYLKQYIKDFGARKCEANAIVPKPDIARGLITDAVLGYLGDDALHRFALKRQFVQDEIQIYKYMKGIDDSIETIIGNL